MRKGRRRLPAGRAFTARQSGGASRRTDQHATRSPADSAQDCEAGGRDLGRAAARGSGASGKGRLGREERGGLRGQCGPGGRRGPD